MTMGREKISSLSSSDPSSPYHDLSSRITFFTHDFFTEQKTFADVYLFRHILHDWSDDDSLKILQSLVPALEKNVAQNNKASPRVLISEGIVPAPPEKRRGTVAGKMIRLVASVPLFSYLFLIRTRALTLLNTESKTPSCLLHTTPVNVASRTLSLFSSKPALASPL